MAVKAMMVIFWVVTSSSLVSDYPKYGRDMFLPYTGNRLQDHTVLQFQRPSSTFTFQREKRDRVIHLSKTTTKIAL
jgi:hypothetical protein